MTKSTTQQTTTKKGKRADVGRGAQWAFYKLEGGTLPYKTYTAIQKDFAEGVGKQIVYDNNIFTMPFGLGTLRIQEKEVIQKIVDGKLVHNLRVDIRATHALWEKDPEAKAVKKRVYYMNDHTDGKVYKFKWDKVSESGRWQIGTNSKWAYYFRPLAVMREMLVAHLKDTTKRKQYFR